MEETSAQLKLLCGGFNIVRICMDSRGKNIFSTCKMCGASLIKSEVFIWKSEMLCASHVQTQNNGPAIKRDTV